MDNGIVLLVKMVITLTDTTVVQVRTVIRSLTFLACQDVAIVGAGADTEGCNSCDSQNQCTDCNAGFVRYVYSGALFYCLEETGAGSAELNCDSTCEAFDNSANGLGTGSSRTMFCDGATTDSTTKCELCNDNTVTSISSAALNADECLTCHSTAAGAWFCDTCNPGHKDSGESGCIGKNC